MNFQRGRQREELEINLIPMIDVLLVILIFLMISTTIVIFRLKSIFHGGRHPEQGNTNSSCGGHRSRRDWESRPIEGATSSRLPMR